MQNCKTVKLQNYTPNIPHFPLYYIQNLTIVKRFMDDQAKKKKGAYVNEKCIGCMLCTQITPEVFEMQDNGQIKAVHPCAGEEKSVQESIDNCPVQAISWKEYEEGECN